MLQRCVILKRIRRHHPGLSTISTSRDLITSTPKGQRRSWQGQEFATANIKNNNTNTDNNDNIKSGGSEGEIVDVSEAAVLWRSGAKTKQEAEQKSAVAGGGEE